MSIRAAKPRSAKPIRRSISLSDKKLDLLGRPVVSLDTPDHCATRVVQMAEAAGVKLTKAGATFPHGKDPHDRNIRLAPSFPSLEQIKQAMELVATCVELVALEQVK